MKHDWVKSTLGHGETMCSRCFITNREAAALGRSDDCDVPPPAPKPTDDNVVTLPVIRVERSEDPHDHYEDDFDEGDCWNCGGEGRVNDCIDGCCVDQDDIYCKYCSKRCDVCRPAKQNPELQEVLREALEKSADPGPEQTNGERK